MALLPPADAGHHIVGQTALGLPDLSPGLASDDALEVADHDGVRVWADDAADEVVGGLDVGDPVANGLVDGVLEGAGTGLDADYLGLKQAHTIDVEGLATNVRLAHVDDALQPEHGASGGGGDAVLSRTGLGDDALLAHVLGEQGLAEGVVDLVGAGVGEVFPLQVDLRSTQVAGQVFGEVERGGAAGVGAEKASENTLEILVDLNAVVGIFQLGHRGHEGFGG